MSVNSAKSNALSARSASDTNSKLNYIAQAIHELAKAVGDIENNVRRITSKTGS